MPERVFEDDERREHAHVAVRVDALTERERAERRAATGRFTAGGGGE